LPIFFCARSNLEKIDNISGLFEYTGLSWFSTVVTIGIIGDLDVDLGDLDVDDLGNVDGNDGDLCCDGNVGNVGDLGDLDGNDGNIGDLDDVDGNVGNVDDVDGNVGDLGDLSDVDVDVDVGNVVRDVLFNGFITIPLPIFTPPLIFLYLLGTFGALSFI
jgi:hypothetical protein